MGQSKDRLAESLVTLPRGAPYLRLAAPAERPTARSETCQPVTLIGSRRDCDLPINESDVSKIHCALVNTGRAIIAVDLCSRCGTFVNNEPISVAPLHPGDTLRVGSVPVAAKFFEAPGAASASRAAGSEEDLRLATPLRLIAPTQSYELALLPAVIGRRQACQIVLDTPDVSLGHALLLAIEGRLAIFDLGSRSGTYVNSERVTLAWLRSGDRLSIGGEQLTVRWEGPESVVHCGGASVALRAPHKMSAAAGSGRRRLNGLGGLGTRVEGLLTQIATSDVLLRDRTAQLTEREEKLETRIAAAQKEQDQLAAGHQQVRRQTAKLRAAWKELGEERSRLEDQRAELERERDQLAQQRAELTKQTGEHQARVGTLAARESALDERAAVLATREKETAEREAALARREAACADTARRIAQLSEALSQAQRAFGSLGELPGPPMAAKGHSDTPAEARRAGTAATTPDAGSEATGAILPAPLVDKPLFRGLEMARRSR